MSGPFMIRGASAGSGGADSPFVSVHRRGCVLHARAIGPTVSQREAPILAQEIGQALAASGSAVRVLLVDVTHVRLMSGMGLGVCVTLSRQAAALGVRTVVYVNAELGQLFRMLKLDQLCTIVDDDSALQRAIAA